MRRRLPVFAMLAALPLLGSVLPGCGSEDVLTIYSGRTRDLIGPLYDRFEETTGIKVKVRYGGSPQLAAQLLEEGGRSKADVYVAQDAGSLGEVASANLLQPLDPAVAARVPASYRDSRGRWVGISARARVVIYNTDRLKAEQLPGSILGFTDPAWKGRLGWAPTNGSFQSFVTAFRKLRGEQAAEEWLRGIKDNGTRSFADNVSIVEATSAGEIDAGFVNHYYALQLHSQGRAKKAENRYYSGDDPGALVNVAGAGVLASSRKKDRAARLVDFLLSAEAQQHFAKKTYEVPTVTGISPTVEVPAIADLKAPAIDLGTIGDLKGTTALLTRLEIL